MEPERKQDRREPDVETTERKTPSSKPAGVTLPFASEGLEPVRDSHT
jgi:hypothetical protein